MLLDYFGDADGAERIEQAIRLTFAAGIRTADLGGTAGTLEFGEAVLQEISSRKKGT
jgi:isocitrate/isopropylmalate dehydrogenase